MSLLAYDKKLSNSLLGRMEVRVKIISLITLILIFSTLKDPITLLVGSGILLLITILSGISLRSFLRRLLWLIPFAGFMIVFFPFITPGKELFTISTPLLTISATEEGLIKSSFLALRVLNATFCISLLVITTPLKELLHGFQQLKVPSIMVSLISFTLRYFEVLADEIKKMQLARKARGFQQGTSFFNKHTMKTIGLLIATLFVRATARGDRIYNAMLSRGYSGEEICCGHCSPQVKDWIAGVTIVAVGLFLKIAEWRGI